MAPARPDGYAPLRDYAVLGDGRTVALVARDGAIDWLCLPDVDSGSVFARILDAERGGSFELCPAEPFEAERRYLPDTNVLETTFTTASGTVRVTDALTIPAVGFAPLRELVRRVEGLAGRVALAWRFDPRFRYAAKRPRIERRAGRFVAHDDELAVGLSTWEAGTPEVGEALSGSFVAEEGSHGLLVLSCGHHEPVVFPARDESERRLDATARFWRDWVARHEWAGPWRDPVMRSALVLKLLIHAPSGAVAAAPTTSLPEAIGGERNWDYRYCWLRDTSYTMDALLHLGCPAEARAFLSWLLHASRLTHPRLQVLYRLDGGADAPERELDHLSGYRGSSPVRVGNGAVGQTQLDIYGSLLETVSMYVREGGPLDGDTGGDLAEVADLVCEIWSQRDAGIWEVRSDPQHFTHSKVMCWAALDRAIRLAESGHLEEDRVERWRKNADAIRDFVEENCWSEERGSYVRAAGSDELDAALLVLPLVGYRDARDSRLQRTVEAVRRELGSGDGPFIHRYRGDDGVSGGEGAFLICSFWYVAALAVSGRVDDAARTMEDLLDLANDVGLYAEEIDPETRDFLGNFPQALSHLALVNAATAFGKADAG